eukprot:g31856.t1
MNEVETTIRSTLELDEGAPLPEICFTCLGGWMARASGEEETPPRGAVSAPRFDRGPRTAEVATAEDEFAQPEPWPWAREELNDFFGILSRDALRQRLDERVGLAMS